MNKTAAERILKLCTEYGSLPLEKKDLTQSPWWIIIDPIRLRNHFDYTKDNDQELGHLIAGSISGPYFSREKAEEYLKQVSYHFSPKAYVYCCGARDAQSWEYFSHLCRMLAKEIPLSPISPEAAFEAGRLAGYKAGREDAYNELRSE